MTRLVEIAMQQRWIEINRSGGKVWPSVLHYRYNDCPCGHQEGLHGYFMLIGGVA